MLRLSRLTKALAVCLLLISCRAAPIDREPAPTPPTTEQPPTLTEPSPTVTQMRPQSDDPSADVVSVDVFGSHGAFRFSVVVKSPDTGCEQYADWWEVLRADGTLVYRRILAHSHVDEQPFTRSGGPVAIDGDTALVVRAHMHPGGYGGVVMRGSVTYGFSAAAGDPGFAVDIEMAEPQPSGCAF